MTVTAAAGRRRPSSHYAYYAPSPLTPLLSAVQQGVKERSKRRRPPQAAQRAAHQERSACRAISSPSGPFSMRRSSRKR